MNQFLPNITYCDLAKELKKYITDDNVLLDIKRAYLYAAKCHAGQKRLSGKDYIVHPLYTALYLAQWRLEPSIIKGGLLHDVLEDSPVTKEKLVVEFGEDVANLVASITKVSYFTQRNRRQIKMNYLLKLYLALAKDIRTILIKLADRLHNVRTIQYLPVAKQKIIAEETLVIYCGIAHRLGMKKLLKALNEVFYYLDRQKYNSIAQKINLTHKQTHGIIAEKGKAITAWIKKKSPHLKFSVFGRYKSIYSIYIKMENQGKKFEDIHDLLAFRVITESVDDCYLILGFLHQKLLPLKQRFKDYIVKPKNNMYQSLHTTVTWPDSMITEIQIRTRTMDEVAENGVASHWSYKEGLSVSGSKKQQDIDTKLNLFRDILNLEKVSANQANLMLKNLDSHKNASDLSTIIQNEIFSNVIYCLTPAKKVITLPHGSCLLDFAFQIHSEIGEHTVGGKVNGSYQPINYVLASGDIVDIKTTWNQKPTVSWLKMVKTNRARQKIARFLRRNLIATTSDIDKNRLQKINRTKEQINQYLAKKHLKNKVITQDEQIKMLERFNFKTLDDAIYEFSTSSHMTLHEFVNAFYLAREIIANEKIASQIIPSSPIKSKTGHNKINFIIVSGDRDIKSHLARCCRPLPYEKICGLVKRGTGIKIHSIACVNIQSKQKRWIDVTWDKGQITKMVPYFEAEIFLVANDRPGLLEDVAKLLNNAKINLKKITAQVDGKDLSIKIFLVVDIGSLERLHLIIRVLSKLPSVRMVQRSAY